MSRWSFSIGMLIPRLVALMLYLMDFFQGSVHVAFAVLGILLMPTSLIWYGVVQRSFGGDWGLVALGGMAVAILIDLGPAAAQRKVRIAR